MSLVLILTRIGVQLTTASIRFVKVVQAKIRRHVTHVYACARMCASMYVPTRVCARECTYARVCACMRVSVRD